MDGLPAVGLSRSNYAWITGKPEVIGSSAVLVPRNALVLTEPINLETFVSRVVWWPGGRSAPDARRPGNGVLGNCQRKIWCQFWYQFVLTSSGTL